MENIKVATGISWVSIPEVDLHILCGCPMDSVKHLMRSGLIRKVSKEGVSFESGPNAILLSDTQMQNGDFANVAEFPVLHMMYRQGMVIPGHPGNTGLKPILIGLEEQLDAQSKYIYRGTYGLTSLEELMEAGITQGEAEEMLSMKNRFNFNNIRRTEDLLNIITVKEQPVEIKDGVFLTRTAFNEYEITYNGQREEVNLNLNKLDRYEPPYNLDFHRVKREYFSVIHIGDGNGWDKNRPCMGSLLTYQGKFYLIDAGPSIQFSLTSLGISVNDIEGIFQTHAHDDHFSGLTSFIHTDHRIKYFATPLVRKSVVKKLTALMGVEEDMFEKSFEIHDMKSGEWNYLDGLEVRPVFSPHPVETSILYFRTFWRNGYRSYGHLADIASDRILKEFLVKDKAGNGISEQFYNDVWKNYLFPTDLKKIDIGGGMIHGHAEDFREDQSRKIILSHTDSELKDSEKEIGSSASFGMQDVLIPSEADYYTIYSRHFLKSLLPDLSFSDRNILQNGIITNYNVGTILIKKGEVVDKLFLIINGLVEMINTVEIRNSIISSGSLLGTIDVIDGTVASQTYRTASYVDVLEIPREIFLFILEKDNIREKVRMQSDKRSFLRTSRILGLTCSCQMINNLAERMELIKLPKGAKLTDYKKKGIMILKSGKISLYKKRKYIEDLKVGRVCLFESLIDNVKSVFTENVESDSEVYLIPFELLSDIPVIHWKFLKVYNHRLRIAEEIN
jgi:hemerythrin